MTGSSISYVAPILKQLPFPEGFNINNEDNQVTSPQENFTFQDDDLNNI